MSVAASRLEKIGHHMRRAAAVEEENFSEAKW